jgi:hypothetical protein
LKINHLATLDELPFCSALSRNTLIHIFAIFILEKEIERKKSEQGEQLR